MKTYIEYKSEMIKSGLLLLAAIFCICLIGVVAVEVL